MPDDHVPTREIVDFDAGGSPRPGPASYDAAGPLDPLVAFLRARLDERERAARFVLSDYAQHEATWTVPSTGVVDIGEDGIADATILTGDGPLAEFIADNDPRFVLDDVAAKRRIIALVLDGDNGVIAADRSIEGEWGCTSDLHEQLLRLLALPFAGHPDYREEWKL